MPRIPSPVPRILYIIPKIYPTRCIPISTRIRSHSTARPNRPLTKLALYIHWPYCKAKCTYCAFNVHIKPTNLINHSGMGDALIKDLDFTFKWPVGYQLTSLNSSKDDQERLKHLTTDLHGNIKQHLSNNKLWNVYEPNSWSIGSVFFGGGTPSLADPWVFERVLKHLYDNYPVDEDVEISLEANPSSLTPDLLRTYKHLGINRLSLGIQSLSTKDLGLLNRDHDSKLAKQSIISAISHFTPDRVSCDLIWGRPDQTVPAWEEELKEVMGYGVGGLSLYQLTLERGTSLHKSVQSGSVTMPSVDTMADLWQSTLEVTKSGGYEQFEVSTFVHNEYGRASKHNTSYWEGRDFVGIGPGAHGRITTTVMENGAFRRQRWRTMKALSPDGWMRACNELGHGTQRIVKVSEEETIQELIVFGLRMRKGLVADMFEEHLNNGKRLEEYLDLAKLDNLVENGFLEVVREDGHVQNIKATTKGLSVLDTVVAELLL